MFGITCLLIPSQFLLPEISQSLSLAFNNLQDLMLTFIGNELIKLKSHEGFHEGWIPITLVTGKYVNVMLMLMLYRRAQTVVG